MVFCIWFTEQEKEVYMVVRNDWKCPETVVFTLDFNSSHNIFFRANLI